MAKSKTGSFWLIESVLLDDSTATQGTIDLGAYVDVGDQQAIAVEQYDVILQAIDTTSDTYSGFLGGMVGGEATIDAQVTDLSRGTLIIPANDRALIGSSSTCIDNTNNVITMGPDIYPDNFGKLDESRMVVNDQLYCTAKVNGSSLATNRNCFVVFRLKCRIVKLQQRDWVALAVQSTAADN